jgi:hypothetical protein
MYCEDDHIIGNEMDRMYSTQEKDKHTYKMLVSKPYDKGRPEGKFEKIILNGT